jgi:O-methyltransferase involved in polyketide biosynthesis
MEIQSADAVVLLDVLHYLSHNDQEKLFDKIRASLATGSVLLTRVSDARSTLRSMLTSLVDRCVLIARGVGATPLFFRSLPEWIDSLERRGFTVTAIPVSQSTAANVMLVARLL